MVSVIPYEHYYKDLFFHIEEVVGSSPSIPTKQKRSPFGDCFCLVIIFKGARSRVKKSFRWNDFSGRDFVPRPT